MGDLIYHAAWEELLPEPLHSDLKIYAMGRAIAEQKRKISAEIWKARAWALIGQLPEEVLDALAYDLDVKWYRGSYSLETKQAIMKNAFRSYKALGTKKSVEDNVTAVFGEGTVVEWFEFDEGDRTPGTFDIISNARLTEDNVKEFQDIIQWSKNARAHIRRVLAERTETQREYAASMALTLPTVKILSGGEKRTEIRDSGRAAVAAVVSDKHIIILN